MSKQGLANAIGLATVDKAFRSRLFKDPEGATSGSNQMKLDRDEIKFLKEKGTQELIKDYSKYLGVTYSGGGKYR